MERPVTTVQQTAKRYKAMQAIGVVVLIFGVVACSASTSTGDAPSGISLLMVFGGLMLYLAGRVLAWWHHG